MRINVLVLTLGVLAMALACAPISKQARMDLDKPVDCSTAPQDIETLEREKASVAKRFADGVTAVYPAAAVISILTKEEKDKYEVAIGHYNNWLTEKIREIKTTCGID